MGWRTAVGRSARPKEVARPVPVEAEGDDSGYKWLVLTIVSIGTGMSALDTGIVTLAYPELTRYFGVPITTISWVSLAYLIVFTASVTSFGRLADLYGRKRVYVAGLLVFSVGSLLCSLAPNVWVLIGARVVESLGGAMALSNSIALLSEVFPARQRGMAIGVLETVVSLALTLGPTLGGYLISGFGWSAIFLINLPIGLLNFGLAVLLLRETGPAFQRGAGGKRRSLDLPGTLSFGSAVAFLLLFLTQGQEQGWWSYLSLVELGLSLLLLVAFVYRENTTTDPAIDLRLFFANRAFIAANAAKILGYNAFFAINFAMPFYFDQLLHLSPSAIGLAVIPFPAAMGLGSVVSTLVADRVSARWLAAAGLVMVAGGGLLLAVLEKGVSYPVLVPALALAGVGMGLFIAPNDKTIMNAAPRDRLGVAASTLALTRSLGIISGVAMAGTLYSAWAGSRPGTNFDSNLSGQGFQVVFIMVTVVALAGAALLAGAGQDG